MSTSTAEPASAPVAPAQETAAPTLSKPPAVAPEVDTPLAKLALELGKLLDDTGYHEVYGVNLQPWTEGTEIPVPQQVILQKFLRANAGDSTKAAEQLEKVLKWRKEFKPLDAVSEVFDKTRFEGLGYVTQLKGIPGSLNSSDVAVFNIYGAVKDNKKTFGDLDGFIRWRVALMEMTIAALHISDAKQPLPDYRQGPDPYQALQIHDYLSVSFLRQAPEVKVASGKTIELFQAMYPETVARKFFVNVPIVMQWMFGAMKLFMAKETIAKMQWMSYGSELHKDLGSDVPKAYGGTGPELSQSASTPKYNDPTATSEAPAPTKTEPAAPASADAAEPSAT